MRNSYDFSKARKNPYVGFLLKGRDANPSSKYWTQKLKVVLLQLFQRAFK